jgi:CRISPR type III-A/MTUBE-associated protein Csm6
MIHICRVYQPTRVILYMSQEILKIHERDNRYIYCLEKLAEMQNRRMNYEIIERKDLKKVYDFDYFYQDFRNIVEKIISGMDETDELLLNISSGTPAMKSGLAVLQTIEEYPSRLIQVITPVRSMNEHNHEDYDVEGLWEVNEDNRPDFENRCREVKCPSLSVIKQEEIIKKHINAYNYSAALEVAESLPKEATENYLHLIQAAFFRSQMDLKKMRTVSEHSEEYKQFIPVKDDGIRPELEYALNIEIKMKRKEYADFLRALTPLLVNVLEIVLNKKCGVSIDNYCSKYGGIRKWDKKRLMDSEVFRVLDETYRERYTSGDGFRTGGPVSSDQLVILIDHFTQDNKVKRLAGELREVEEKVRNIAAHEIVSISNEQIEKDTGFRAEQIMHKIHELFKYTGYSIPDAVWTSYDRMNENIISHI